MTRALRSLSWNWFLAAYVALIAVLLFATLGCVVGGPSFATAAAGASTDPVADTRQILAGTVTTTKAKTGYLSGANDRTTAFQGALSAYKAVRAAEPPLTVKCADGTLVAAPGACPMPAPAMSTAGLPPIADNFDTAAALETFPLPQVSADDVGAFRMLCEMGKLIRDDPVVKPGQPGASHLHMVWGNQSMDAFSTYATLRANGSTTCGVLSGPINRSAMWMPAMLDGAGNAVMPDFIQNYYKQQPSGSAECVRRAPAGCIGLPNGIKYVYGWNPVTMAGGPTDLNSMDYWATKYQCWSDNRGTLAVPGVFHTIADVVAAGCPSGAHLIILFAGPPCWNGQIDSPDHRSHLDYGTPESGGQLCPATHPYLIASWQGWMTFTTDANFVAGNWHLSSDEMLPGFVVGPSSPVKAGTTLHFDYEEAWSPAVKAMWQQFCIDGHKSCSSGDLGNGTRIKGAEGPTMPAHRLVPVP